jgi:hypothetical protein
VRVLFITTLIIGLCIAGQSLRLHLQTEALARSLRNEFAGLKNETNAAQVETLTASAFDGLTSIKRSFKPVAAAGLFLSAISLVGLVLHLRHMSGK